ncbi:SDR family NAD(P)-dependent oxidoreductase [Canibacter oris]|uniref:NAD(P)-dependent dehydrogenase (Short-subunit alcohol dehydrogenase family) n=1 Tax=Canibacter oris TaxID=1365628 RepID=A0A840DJT4_9MICO|nr:SDR family oxidoreductase [Canibacter oris]MBB4071985.1 NAD(P)-dependent dehydrogenase (short-subunit alcohol dehydrogenase family) [Canibacter oris]
MDFKLADLPSLAGQKVLITGAAGHLGQEITAIFAARGAAVAVHARKLTQAENTVTQVRQRVEQLLQLESAKSDVGVASGELYPLAADLGTATAANTAVNAAAAALGGLTGVINCAAVQPVQDFAAITATEWQHLLTVNLQAAHLTTQAAAGFLAGGGWVTHISSIEGERPATGHAHYAVSKAALNMHARAAALELGAQRIRVNAVAPGLILRPGIAAQWPAGVTSWKQHAPLGELVTAAEVAAACAFLASPAARSITGQVLAVDAGMLTTPGW